MPAEMHTISNEEVLRVDEIARPSVANRLGFAWGWYTSCKRAFDVVLAFVLLAASAPVILLCVLLVRLTSRGPGLYSQCRVGLHGRVFRIFKLRTMYHNCEKRGGAKWSRPGDPRVTPVGRFLRRSHLDELPQLWNVLRGEMSLVGPRPERPEFVPELSQAIPRFPERLNLRPGLTGLAQVQLPPDTDVDSVRRKLAYDLYYSRRLGLWLDLRLLLATAAKVLGVPFWLTGSVLRLPSGLPMESAAKDRKGSAARITELKPALQNA